MTERPPPIRFGVAGCGVIAYWSHLRELPHVPGAVLVAAADPEAGARRRAARLSRIPVHESVEALLDRPGIDAVVISAPTHLHAPVAIAAAAARKHLYVEKPIAANLEQAAAVIAAARRAGVAGAVGFNRRFHPLVLQARPLLASGAIGALQAVVASFCEPAAPEDMPQWKRSRSSGGGVLLDLASHHIDLLRWLLEDEIAEAQARIESRSSEGDQAWLRLTMRSGVEVNGFYSFRAARADFIELLGTAGVLRLDRHRACLSLRAARRYGYGVRGVLVPPTRELLSWWPRRLISPSCDPSCRRALSAFVARIHGQPSQLASLEDGARALEAVMAAEQSSSSGKPVAVSPAVF